METWRKLINIVGLPITLEGVLVLELHNTIDHEFKHSINNSWSSIGVFAELEGDSSFIIEEDWICQIVIDYCSIYR